MRAMASRVQCNICNALRCRQKIAVAPSATTIFARRYFAASAAGFFKATHPQHALITFKLADIGEGIAEVELLKWFIKEGDTIDEMDNLCEVQSDKSAVEISSPHSGKITKFHHQIGEMVKIGAPLMDIEVDGEEASPAATTEKDLTAAATESSLTATATESSTKAEVSHVILASPACRAFARHNKVNLADVPATGPGGRVLKDDVSAFLSSNIKEQPIAAAPAVTPPSTTQAPVLPTKQMTPPVTRVTGDLKEIVLLSSGVAKGMVKSMIASLQVPHMSLQEDVDMTELMSMRMQMNQHLSIQKPPVKITITSLIIKAVSEALKHVPIMNSKFNAETLDRYTLYHSHNISVAIDTPNGLLVPNIKNVEAMSLLEIQEHLLYLQHLSANNKLTPAHLTGGTISISNVGVIGGTAVRPILFDGQATILGLGRLQKLPKYNSATKTFDARDFMNITASVDHRHVDGATVARFISHLRALMTNPALMLL